VLSSPEVWKEFFEIYYRSEVNKLAYSVANGNGSRSLYVNLEDVGRYREGKLVEELLNNPEIVIDHANKGLELAENIYGVTLTDCQVRFYNSPFKVLIREIRCNHISKFISIEGIVRKVTEVRPRVVIATFICKNCGKRIEVPQDSNTLLKPYECRACKGKKFEFLPEESKTIDSQRVRIQEYPENLKGGEQPQSIDVILEGDIAGIVKPGDRVIVNGIIKPRPRVVNRKYTPHMDIYMVGNSVEILQQEYEELVITEEDKKKILELSKDPNIYEKIVKSIAPAIYGHEDVKLAIALQLFGGVPKKLPDGTEIRGDIHILLVGDPGTAKSQLLRYVHKIAPRSIYTSGKGTTTAGLTATVVRDEVDGRWTLEAGALVLADKGIALVDEIDKMRKEDRSALHEALEQQSISISKAGITAVLKARCALLAAANPKYGRFNRYEPLVEQINLEPPLLSRFDLIFIVTDEPDEERDELLARHVVDVHELGEKLELVKVGAIDPKSVEEEKVKPVISPELLRKYIAFAKKTVFPVLTKEAKDRIVEFYKSLRAMAKNDEHASIPITPRQLEALIRLSEASARVRLSNKVTVEDVERAIRIFKRSLEQIAIDPETGKIDIDYAFTGTSATQRDRIALIKKIIEVLENEHEVGAPEEEVIKMAEEKGISREKVEEIISKLKEKGEIYSPRYGYYRIVKYEYE